MGIRILFLLVGVGSFSGCATTGPKVTPINQIQNQMVDLEQRMEEQEKEIVNIKYDVKELQGKGDRQDDVVGETSATSVKGAMTKGEPSGLATEDLAGIVKVQVSADRIQKALKNAGFYDGKIDGKIGSRTKSAVMEFQKQHGLKADGVIGQKTWSELKTYLNE